MRMLAQKIRIISAWVPLVALASTGMAQENNPAPNPLRERATRAELVAIAESAEALAKTAPDKDVRTESAARASAARRRLSEGDLRVGDIVIVEVINFPQLNDTAQVRNGQVIEIQGFPAIPVRGILRAELDAHLTKHLSQMGYNEPKVRTIPMIRLAVSGGVARPGFNNFRMDAILSDVITAAGGYTPEANTKKVQIRRGNDIRWEKEQTVLAMADGWSLDSLQLISGDEVVVARKGASGLLTALAIASTITTLALTIISLSRQR